MCTIGDFEECYELNLVANEMKVLVQDNYGDPINGEYQEEGDVRSNTTILYYLHRMNHIHRNIHDIIIKMDPEGPCAFRLWRQKRTLDILINSINSFVTCNLIGWSFVCAIENLKNYTQEKMNEKTKK